MNTFKIPPIVHSCGAGDQASVKPRYVAAVDSCVSLVTALANALQGRPHARPPVPLVAQTATLLQKLPRSMVHALYRFGGWWEGVPVATLNSFDPELMNRWLLAHYPPRRYPCIAVGSANGAVVHLCAALGIPWLPQTVNVAVRRSLAADEVGRAVQWVHDTVQPLLRNHPGILIHALHDPVQDRHLLAHMALLRTKRLTLGQCYRDFILQHLAPGGTILTIECGLAWKGVRLDERLCFQLGGYGDTAVEEYYGGGARVEAFLRSYGSAHRSWSLHHPIDTMPEAEWGYITDVNNDIKQLCTQQGYRLKRLCFSQPESLSGMVADIYKQWYHRYGIPTGRLMVECFSQMSPWWALRSGSIPYWMAFNTGVSLSALKRYLDTCPGLEEMYLMLMSHGVEGIGHVPIEQWMTLLGNAAQSGRLLANTPRYYPRDFASFQRLRSALESELAAHTIPVLPPLMIDEVMRFVNKYSGGEVVCV